MPLAALKEPDNCIVVLTIKLLTNDAEIFLWKHYKKMKWI